MYFAMFHCKVISMYLILSVLAMFIQIPIYLTQSVVARYMVISMCLALCVVKGTWKFPCTLSYVL